MNKDKGKRDQKKAPAGKFPGKEKVLSAYKLEGKNEKDNEPSLEVFATKPGAKAGNRKP